LGLAATGIVEWPVSKPTVFETLIWTGPLYPPGLLLARREAYEKVGLYDVSLKHCEDWDMCLRLSRNGRIEFVDEVLLQYRRHASNQSNDVSSSGKMVRQLYHKTFFAAENSAQQREILKCGWRAWQRFKIGEKWKAAVDSSGVRKISAIVKALVATPIHALRAVRGYPTRIWF
jgi:GT2 family glycosyltransferase